VQKSKRNIHVQKVIQGRKLLRKLLIEAEEDRYIVDGKVAAGNA
jgi:hypothetical protein